MIEVSKDVTIGPDRSASRVLSLDPRIGRTGFACFEGSLMVDWGMKTVPFGLPSDKATKRAVVVGMALIDGCTPDVLLLPRPRRDGANRSERVCEVIDALSREARRRGIIVQAFTSREVRDALAVRCGRPLPNKAAVSRALAEVYPELKAYLLRPRRTYDVEEYYGPLINAVGMYCAWRGKPVVETKAA